ncbi:MAG: hypothetical protein QGF53_13965 [Alphaproteobacteria bacterium]|nr:hypothetical protein [Alphaproteobacteria bacterium]
MNKSKKTVRAGIVGSGFAATLQLVIGPPVSSLHSGLTQRSCRPE